MAPSQEFQEQNPFSIFDALYCEEERWEDEEEEEEEEEEDSDDYKDESFKGNKNGGQTPLLLPLLLLDQDLFFEDEELLSLFFKETEEKQGRLKKEGDFLETCCLRKEAVEWILKVNSYYGFSTLTSVLAVNYFDRFFTSFSFKNDKPWMFQLAAVACLSLAAKVEETHVPLLLDLQVEGGKYVFDAKTIQKMELLVLSTLEWKMYPVNALSFLDHIIRRLGLKNHLHWEFLKRCEELLLSLLPDWRFVEYLPSVLATATMMHVIDQIETCNPLDYQNQLLSVLNISKDKVNDCYQLIVEKSASNKKSDDNSNSKRTFHEMMNNFPSSPNGVMDAYYLSCDSSNDSWASNTTINIIMPSSSSSSMASSPLISRKRSRVDEQPMPLQLPSLS